MGAAGPGRLAGRIGAALDRYQLCHVLVWLHLALTSIRNAPLFALVAAPALATLIDGLPLPLRAAWKRPARPAIFPASRRLACCCW